MYVCMYVCMYLGVHVVANNIEWSVCGEVSPLRMGCSILLGGEVRCPHFRDSFSRYCCCDHSQPQLHNLKMGSPIALHVCMYVCMHAYV